MCARGLGLDLVGSIDREGLLMAQSFVCYKLTGHTADKATEVWYFGYVRVLARQTLQQAVDWRKGKHLRALKWCLRDVNPGTVEAVPLGHRLPELQSMKMEAASMVHAWKTAPAHARVRGGPFVLYGLAKAQEVELAALAPFGFAAKLESQDGSSREAGEAAASC